MSEKTRKSAESGRLAETAASGVCPACGSRMAKKRDRSSSGGCGLFVIGAGLSLVFFFAFFWPGLLVSVPMMLLAPLAGGRRAHYWRCRSCGARFDRSVPWYRHG